MTSGGNAEKSTTSHLGYAGNEPAKSRCICRDKPSNIAHSRLTCGVTTTSVHVPGVLKVVGGTGSLDSAAAHQFGCARHTRDIRGRTVTACLPAAPSSRPDPTSNRWSVTRARYGSAHTWRWPERPARDRPAT